MGGFLFVEDTSITKSIIFKNSDYVIKITVLEGWQNIR